MKFSIIALEIKRLFRATPMVGGILIMAIVSLATAPVLASAEYTIATVDVNRLLNESKEAKNRRKELDEMSSKAKAKIEDKKKALQVVEKKIKEGAIQEDSPEAEKFRNDARDFARYIKDTEADIKSEFLKSNKALTEKTLTLISKYAESNGIDLVLDKSSGGRGPVLYGNNTADITDAIVAQLNG
ncbi:MAG: OmpH family outer membrane protein [Deltaproteobacteria bacterium]|nr:OmpH family outer membrane protein [Deltaproteobacteria bacterium]